MTLDLCFVMVIILTYYVEIIDIFVFGIEYSVTDRYHYAYCLRIYIMLSFKES